MKLVIVAVVLFTLINVSNAGESRIKSAEISSDNTPEAIEHAKRQGIATALSDIEAGRPVIIYYGLPWSVGKPLIDDATGLPIEIVAGCTVTGAFAAEVNAYNATIRDWHTKEKQPAVKKDSFISTAGEYSISGGNVRIAVTQRDWETAPKLMLDVRFRT